MTSGRVSAAITTGDGTLDPSVTNGNSVLIGYNTPAPTPQCVKVWSGGTSATVAVTEDPEPGSALLFYRLVKRVPGAAYDDVYFSLDPVLSPPSEGPYTVNVQVDNGAAYEVWFKNVKAGVVELGCTYTQGYWKTHSHQGPAPYDAGWQKLGAGVDGALAGAESLFGGLATGSNALTSEQRTQALAWAGTLDSYNNGITGRGHCP